MSEKAYMARINRLKDRVLNTRPEMDLENAVLLTRGFQESEGEPFVVQKAYPSTRTVISGGNLLTGRIPI